MSQFLETINEDDIVNGTLTIPEGVEKLSVYPNIDILSKIKKVVLPKSYKDLGPEFNLFTNLEEINLENIETINYSNVFANNIHLKEANLTSIKEINPYVLSSIIEKSKKIVINNNIVSNRQVVGTALAFIRMTLITNYNSKRQIVFSDKVDIQDALTLAENCNVVLSEKEENREGLQKYLNYYSKLSKMSKVINNYESILIYDNFNSYEDKLQEFHPIKDYLDASYQQADNYLLEYAEVAKYDDTDVAGNLILEIRNRIRTLQNNIDDEIRNEYSVTKDYIRKLEKN